LNCQEQKLGAKKMAAGVRLNPKGSKMHGTFVTTYPAITYTLNNKQVIEKFKTSSARLEGFNALKEQGINAVMTYSK
jgi:hypothetical protein